MKPITDKNKSIKTTPKGVWESTRPRKEDHSGKSSATMDLQGNGYHRENIKSDKKGE